MFVDRAPFFYYIQTIYRKAEVLHCGENKEAWTLLNLGSFFFLAYLSGGSFYRTGISAHISFHLQDPSSLKKSLD